MARWKQKFNLLLSLLDGRRPPDGPLYVTVDATSRCNLRCVGCPIHSPHGVIAANAARSAVDLPEQLFRELCAELNNLGTDDLTLSGDGEPLLHPRIAEIVAIATARGLRVGIITNGILLDGPLADAIIAAGVERLRVSLWAVSPKRYAQNYPGSDPANRERIIRGLARINETRRRSGRNVPRTTLHMVINRTNWREIPDMVRLAGETGCSAVSYSPLRDFHGVLHEHQLERESEAAVVDLLRRAAADSRRYGLRHNVPETIRRYGTADGPWRETDCYIAWYHARIKADGRVYPCNFIMSEPLGDLNRSTFQDIWRGPAFQDFRRGSLGPDRRDYLAGRCDCAFCCHLTDNRRVHRVGRWIRTFRREDNPIP